MAIYLLNNKADVLSQNVAFQANCHAAKSLQNILKTNLGPKGTLKLLVGGGGQLKLTKDGGVLLHEMQIQHPTASMIARGAVAQDDICGDGTTSNVILLGEIMKESEQYINAHIHPAAITEGIELAKEQALIVLSEMKINVDIEKNMDILENIVKTSLKSKIKEKIANKLSTDLIEAILIIKNNNSEIDLHMVEIMHMKHKLSDETRLIRGMVLDHGCRHPDMPKLLENCFILTCNISLEYEKSEVNSSFLYKNAHEKELLVCSERKFTDIKVAKIIQMKNQICTLENKKNFVILNQKGIDPPSLDMLAKAGIMALRRVKRRNMERLQLCCGGNAVNCVDELCIDDLGYAGLVHEHSLGEEKYTFVENVLHPKSCCILVKGPNDHTISQIKDAIRDGLRTIRNTIEDKSVIPGAGAFEIAAHYRLQQYMKNVSGKQKYGIDIFSKALLCIPKTLAENSGLDIHESILNLCDTYEKNNDVYVGLDINSGLPIVPDHEGIYDNYCVKKQMLSIAPALAQQLLLVDEIVKAGKSMGNNNN